MGMFDSLYDAEGLEWQTKAFACDLDTYRVGDRIPAARVEDFQVEILGGRGDRDSYATVRGGVLASIDDARDVRLPLLDYHGYQVEAGV